MKNNFKNFLALYFFFLLIWIKPVLSNEIEFTANEIDTIDKEIIIASGNVKIQNNTGQVITADKLEYDKSKKIHKVTGNIFYKDNSSNQIYSEKLIIDENKKVYTFLDNIQIKNVLDNLQLSSNKIVYNRLDETIESVGLTELNKNNQINIKTSNIIFKKKDKILLSNDKSTIIDSLKNNIEIEKFYFSLKKNQIIADQVMIIDKDKNKYEIEKIYYDLNKAKIYGKDIIINSDNELLSSKKHLARSKSRSLISEKNFLTLNKTVYTNCKKRDNDRCPPWLIQAEKIEHDKKNKIINYKNALLKFYNVPVLYFPKFFHPDPTVKRQSGFLTPVFSTQNTNGYLKLPYFFAISESSDFTFSPRFYDNSKNLYQGEYRKITENSNHIFDLSIKNDNPLLLDKNSSDTHFFSKSSIKSNFDYFDNSQFNIKLQTVSDEKYLKQFNVKSPIIESQTILNSIIKFEGSNEDLEFAISTEVYEDLSKKNNNDRHEFILPNYNFTKKLNLNFDGQLEFNSLGYNKLYDTNVNEKILVNDLNYKSFDYINNYGFISNYEVNLKNFNADSKNSKSLKNKTENTLQGLIQFNSKLPMFKESKNFRKTLTPIISAKFNPTTSNKDIKNDNKFVDYTNIFSINRLSSNEVLEGGESISIGNEYKIFKKKDLSDEIFSLNLAASFRKNENSDLPLKSSLGQKTSNITGQSKIKMNNYVNIDYDFLLDNNLGKFNYHKIKSNFKVNNFVTSFEFIEESNDIGDESFLANETSYEFDQSNSLIFRTRKNKKTNLTEYYDLIYQYKMDCLTAGIEYKKTYYTDELIKPEESIFFSITFLPFNNTIDLPGVEK